MSNALKSKSLSSRGVRKDENRVMARPTAKKAQTNTFTAAFEQTDDGWWVGKVLEVPGALTQGKTLDEARENLQEALSLILECQRDESRRELAGHNVVEEIITVKALIPS
jgi:predicted RNase H-like HicB family nuclease